MKTSLFLRVDKVPTDHLHKPTDSILRSTDRTTSKETEEPVLAWPQQITCTR